MSTGPRTRAEEAIAEAWATDRYSVFEDAVRVIEDEARREAIDALLDRLTSAVEGLPMMQDGVIRTMAGTDRPPRTPADCVELYRAAVLELLAGERVKS